METERQAMIASAINELAVDGRVTPSAVVDAAKDPHHPLHNEFPWNDAEAAHQRRLDIARALIRSVKIVVVTETRRIKTVAYGRDPQKPAGTQGYVHVGVLKQSPDDARSLLHYELDQMIARLKRCEGLAAVLGLEEMLLAIRTQAGECLKKVG